MSYPIRFSKGTQKSPNLFSSGSIQLVFATGSVLARHVICAICPHGNPSFMFSCIRTNSVNVWHLHLVLFSRTLLLLLLLRSWNLLIPVTLEFCVTSYCNFVANLGCDWYWDHNIKWFLQGWFSHWHIDLHMPLVRRMCTIGYHHINICPNIHTSLVIHRVTNHCRDIIDIVSSCVPLLCHSCECNLAFYCHKSGDRRLLFWWLTSVWWHHFSSQAKTEENFTELLD